MAPFVLKFKGNKSFSPFSNLADSESLTRTWKVCTKVAAHLEQGQRLENLAWRLFFIHNVMVDSDSARSKREFKKMTKFMGERLDKEKGRSIEELQAPDFKRTDSVEKLVKRAAEKERSREEAVLHPHIHPNGGSMKGMQYTFSVNPNTSNPGAHPARHQLNNGGIKRKIPPTSVSGPNQNAHSDEVGLVSGRHSRSNSTVGSALMMTPLTTTDPASADGTLSSSRTSSVMSHSPSTSLSASPNSIQSTLPSSLASSVTSLPDQVANTPGVLRFPTLFSSDFGPGALLCTPSSTIPSLSYGEDTQAQTDSWGVLRPAFEFPLDEIMKAESEGWNPDTEMKDATPTPGPMSAVESTFSTPTSEHPPSSSLSISIPPPSTTTTFQTSPIKTESILPQYEEMTKSPTLIPLPLSPPLKPSSGPKQRTRRRGNSTMLPPPAIPSRSIHMTTSTSSQSRSTAPSATPPPRGIRQYVNSAPGGVKSECANCGANSTPLWRRGLNDELNCNACGLFAKLHKRPRPKSLRANTTDSTSRTTSWAAGTIHTPVEGNDTPTEQVQCYNCQTTATPLWRKDEEGRTLCNACGLYLKLHGEKRPSSMKSDVIRKRSRHDGRRGSSSAATPSASPGASRRTSPVRAHSPLPEPTYAPVPPPQYDFGPNFDFSHHSPPDSTSADLMSMGMGLSSSEDHHNAFNMSPFNTLLFSDTANYPGPVSAYNLAAYWGHLGAGSASSIADSSMEGSTSSLTDSLVDSLVDTDGGNKRRRVSPDDDAGSNSMDSAVDSPTVELGSTFMAQSNESSQNSSQNSIDAGLNLSFDALSFSYNPFSYAFSTGDSFVHPPMLLPYADPMSSLGNQQQQHSHNHHSPASSSVAHQSQQEDNITPDSAEPVHHSLQ